VPVDTLFVYLSRGYTLQYFLTQFPSVKREQALGLLDRARQELPEFALREANQAAQRAAG